MPFWDFIKVCGYLLLSKSHPTDVFLWDFIKVCGYLTLSKSHPTEVFLLVFIKVCGYLMLSKSHPTKSLSVGLHQESAATSVTPMKFL